MIEDRFTLAQTAAQKAGQYLLDQFHNGNRQGSLKSDHTLVTAADREADRIIGELIQAEYPDDGILSEEGSTIFPESEYAWVIDPLDGTVNFSQGLLYWGVSIAVLESGFPRAAAVYFPTSEELFTACSGAGAQVNGRSLRVEDRLAMNYFPVFVHCSRMHQRYQVDLPYKKRSLGAAAYHLCLVANNTAVLAFESTPRIWDFAGGWLVVEEAGGVIRAFQGDQPFPAQPGADYHHQPFPIAAAASEEIFNQAKGGITRR
jgi:myo-inositol-1(or 4)-monophosphatase